MPNFQPTAEQQAIIDAAKTGGSIKVEAGAGTGKTTTLGLVAEALPGKSILYLAFGRALADEAVAKVAAGDLPSNIEPRTAHSLAYRQIARKYNMRARQGKAPKGRDIAALLGIRQVECYDNEGERVTFSPRQIGTMVRETISKFCASADREVTLWHVRKSGTIPELSPDCKAKLEATVLSYAQRAWTEIADPKSNFPWMPGRGDSCYLKLWSLSDPQLPYDVILFDEAQDADPAIAHVVEIQRNCQRILVGDRAQAIYEWRGAIDAMQRFDADHHLFLSQSFRFGAAIAEQANQVLPMLDTPLRLKGLESIASTTEPTTKPTAILCRTNAGVLLAALEAQNSGVKVAIAGGTKQIEGFCWSARNLMNGEAADYPELAGYSDWSEVQQAVENGEADDIAMMVKLIDTYGVSTIIAVCKNSVSLRDAELVVSTGHKAKGLEWDHVRIGDDFRAPKNGSLSKAEARLIYVAITRAKLSLDTRALHWLADAVQEAIAEATEGDA